MTLSNASPFPLPNLWSVNLCGHGFHVQGSGAASDVMNFAGMVKWQKSLFDCKYIANC